MVSDDQQLEKQRALVRRMLAYANTDASNGARKARLSPSTLTRFLNNPDVKRGLSQATLKKLSEALHFPLVVEESFVSAGVVRPALAVIPLQNSIGYVVEYPDQVALLRLWDLLSTAEKKAMLDHLMNFILSKRTDPA